MTQELKRTDLYRTFIGKARTEYYLKQFAAFDEQGGGFYPSWNWAAFFFSAFWVQYRKLHGLFWALLLVALFIAIGQSSEILGVTFLVGCPLGLGAYGNAFYYRRAKKIIAKAHTQAPDPQELLSYLGSGGGVDKRNPELFVILVIGVALMYLFYGARDDYVVRSTVGAAVRTTVETRKTIEALVKNHRARFRRSRAVGPPRQRWRPRPSWQSSPRTHEAVRVASIRTLS